MSSTCSAELSWEVRMLSGHKTIGRTPGRALVPKKNPEISVKKYRVWAERGKRGKYFSVVVKSL